MAASFFNFPLEIRLKIYRLAFGNGKAVIETRDEDDSCCMVPLLSTFQNQSPRSSQLLRVNKTILLEARPVLYTNTVFHVVQRVFAGNLPTQLSDGHFCAQHIKHLIWQLDCDMLKHFYAEDLRFDLAEVSRLSSLEIRCRADTWRNSFVGEWCDREAFVKGRAQIIEYARMFPHAMSAGNGSRISFVEDRSQLGRGRIILRLSRDEYGWKEPQNTGDDLLAISISQRGPAALG